MSSNFEVEEVGEGREPSACEKLCTSIIVAVLVAPILLIISILILGGGEKSAVCNDRAFIQGERDANVLDCSAPATTSDGKLVFLSCPVTGGGKMLNELDSNLNDFYRGPEISQPIYGISATVEMFQCIEDKSESTYKDSATGKTMKKTTYSYKKDWRSSLVELDSAAMARADKQSACGKEANPTSWPSSVNLAVGTTYVKEVKMGQFTVDKSAGVELLPINTPVQFQNIRRGPWNHVEGGTLYVMKPGATIATIGTVRAAVKTTSQTNTLTAVGKNVGGKISSFMADATWLCSEIPLENYKYGATTKDEYFSGLKAGNNAMLWVCRIGGFFLMWFALTRFFGPLEVMAECVPCIGPMLGDMVEAVVCILSCPPACGCCLCICGVVWVVMRPEVGIPMMICWCCCMGGMVAAKVYMKNQASGHQDLEGQS